MDLWTKKRKNMKEWLKASNRWKHLVGGAVVGAAMFNVIDAVMACAAVGGALEFKDKAWGGKWDWIDFSLTVAGGVVAGLLRYIIGL